MTLPTVKQMKDCDDEIERLRAGQLSGYTLSREQAIKRIKDIQSGISVDHLSPDALFKGEKTMTATIRHSIGAKQELMAIFDIKEEELK